MDIHREQHPAGIVSQVRFVRDSSLFSLSLLLSGVCSLIRSLVVAKFLGPQGFGIWRFVNIFAEYHHIVSLGTQPALHRMVPFLRGKGDRDKLQAVLHTVSATDFYSSLIYSVAVFCWSLTLTEPLSAYALAAFAPVILLSTWLYYATGFSIVTGLYGLRSWLEIVYGVSTLVFSVTLVQVWGVYGAIAGAGISALITVGVAALRLRQYFSLTIEWHMLWELMITGFPIMANGLLLTTMGSIDKILISATMSQEMLGIYSVGNAYISILGTIPAAFGQMLFVKFAEMDGRNTTKTHIAEVLEKSTVILASLFAPITAVAIASFPLIVVWLLPQYVKGIASGKLLIAGTFFLAVSLPMTNWCVSTGRFAPVLGLRLLVVALEFLTVSLVISTGTGLEGIALGVLGALAVFSTTMILVGNQLLEQSLSRGLARAGGSMLPFVSVLVALFMQGYVYPLTAYTPGMRLYTSSLLAAVMSVVVSLPFVYWANKRTQLMRLLVKSMQSSV
jgi:O-antigen/teichoic acid export membrane protein